MVDKEYILSKNNSYSPDKAEELTKEDLPSDNDIIDATENLNQVDDKNLSSYDMEEDKQFYQEVPEQFDDSAITTVINRDSVIENSDSSDTSYTDDYSDIDEAELDTSSDSTDVNADDDEIKHDDIATNTMTANTPTVNKKRKRIVNKVVACGLAAASIAAIAFAVYLKSSATNDNTNDAQTQYPIVQQANDDNKQTNDKSDPVKIASFSSTSGLSDSEIKTKGSVAISKVDSDGNSQVIKIIDDFVPNKSYDITIDNAESGEYSISSLTPVVYNDGSEMTVDKYTFNYDSSKGAIEGAVVNSSISVKKNQTNNVTSNNSNENSSTTSNVSKPTTQKETSNQTEEKKQTNNVVDTPKDSDSGDKKNTNEYTNRIVETDSGTTEYGDYSESDGN